MNPYPNRPHPVGKLEYPLKDDIGSIKGIAMLEFGEEELLYDIPRLIGGGNIANLGHARGGSAILLARGLKDRDLDGHVTSVDVFKAPHRQQLDAVIKVLVETDALDRVTIRHGRTDDVGEQLFNEGRFFSFVFIDADHSYDGVKNDFLLWSQMVEIGGWIGFHDTNQEFSRKVLDEELIGNANWKEHEDLHVNRIRIFEKLR